MKSLYCEGHIVDRNGEDMQRVLTWWICSLALLCLAVCGCTREEVDGNTTIFSHDPWAGLAAALASVATFGLAAIVYRTQRHPWLRGAAMSLSPVGALFFAYTVKMFTEETIVAPDRAIVRTRSMQLVSTEKTLVFADMTFLELTEEVSTERHGNQRRYPVYVTRTHSGQEIRLISSPPLRKAMPKLAVFAKAAGVRIESRLARDIGMKAANHDSPMIQRPSTFGFPGGETNPP